MIYEEKKFKYSSKKEYEDALVKIALSGKKKGDEYDELLDEYLEFCGEKNVK